MTRRLMLYFSATLLLFALVIGGIFGFIGTLNTLLFENWRLKTTAEEIEMEEIAEQTKKQIAEENAAEDAKKAKGGSRK